MQKNPHVAKFCIDLKDAIDMMYGAWQDVSAVTISNCFHHARISQDAHEAETIPLEIVEPEEYEEFLGSSEVSFEDYLDFDNGLKSSEELTDEELIAPYLADDDESTDDETEDTNEESGTPEILTDFGAASRLQELDMYFQSKDDTSEEVFSALNVLTSTVNKVICNKKKTQPKISDFFGKE